YFIFLTGVIAILAAYFSYRVRFYSYAQEMQLQKSNEALQEMDRRKSEFIANVSHELRTPVAVIVGPAKHLLQQQANLLPAPARKVLEQIVRNGGRLTKLVND
ncbi:histidine kinase dimerization/phospho-acceptor domain-containing protein, partial [Staphylococcus sp. SIMBA_130]